MRALFKELKKDQWFCGNLTIISPKELFDSLIINYIIILYIILYILIMFDFISKRKSFRGPCFIVLLLIVENSKITYLKVLSFFAPAN